MSMLQKIKIIEISLLLKVRIFGLKMHVRQTTRNNMVWRTQIKKQIRSRCHEKLSAPTEEKVGCVLEGSKKPLDQCSKTTSRLIKKQ